MSSLPHIAFFHGPAWHLKVFSPGVLTPFRRHPPGDRRLGHTGLMDPSIPPPTRAPAIEGAGGAPACAASPGRLSRSPENPSFQGEQDSGDIFPYTFSRCPLAQVHRTNSSAHIRSTVLARTRLQGSPSRWKDSREKNSTGSTAQNGMPIERGTPVLFFSARALVVCRQAGLSSSLF